MFTLNLKEEDIIMKITAHSLVWYKDVIFIFIGNLLTNAGGDIADKVNIILVKHFIILEYKGHTSIGYTEETRNVIRISIELLDEFKVTKDEDKEIIEIGTLEKKYTFVRDNSNEDNLASYLCKEVNKIKTLNKTKII